MKSKSTTPASDTWRISEVFALTPEWKGKTKRFTIERATSYENLAPRGPKYVLLGLKITVTRFGENTSIQEQNTKIVVVGKRWETWTIRKHLC